MAFSGNRRGGRGGGAVSSPVKMTPFTKLELVSDSEEDEVEQGQKKQPAPPKVAKREIKGSKKQQASEVSANEVAGPSDMNVDDAVEVEDDVEEEEVEDEEEEEHESESEVEKSDKDDAEWTPSMEDMFASGGTVDKNKAGNKKKLAEVPANTFSPPAPLLPTVTVRVNQQAKQKQPRGGAKPAANTNQGRNKNNNKTASALPVPVPLPVLPAPQQVVDASSFAALSTFNLPALREHTLGLLNLLTTIIDKVPAATAPIAPLALAPQPLPIPVPAPAPVRGRGRGASVAIGGKRKQAATSAPQSTSVRRPFPPRGGARGGGGGRRPTATSFSPVASAPINANEPIAVQPSGSKVGQPYTGSPVVPEQVASTIFSVKTGPARLPILFVLAPNPEGETVIDFGLVHRAITAGGGMVIANLDGLPTGRLNLSVAPALAFCVATSPNLTPEFLFGVAYGARCIYPTWVLECASTGRLLDHSEYILSAGQDLFGNTLFQHRRRMIFGGRKMVVAGPSVLAAARLAKVLNAAGASASFVTGDGPIDEADQRRVQEASFILVQPECAPAPTSPIVELAQNNEKNFVTSTWLAQSLLVGRVIEPSCNVAFVWRPGTGVKQEPGTTRN